MKSLTETIQDIESKKRKLEENVDSLNENMAALKASGRSSELHREKTGLLPSNCTADQRLSFRYTDSTIPLLPKS